MIKNTSVSERIRMTIDSGGDKKNKAPGLVEGTSLYALEHSVSGTPRTNNTSGVTGVSYKKKQDRWVAYIKYKGKLIQLGTFKNKEDATQARKEAEEILFKPLIEKYDADSEGK